MFEHEEIDHHIQQFIMKYLALHEYARFRDLRPPKTDTNLAAYHLKLLQKHGFVTKTDQGYTLSQRGLMFVDRVTLDKMKVRTQPKIITMLLVQNSNGDVLLQRRTKQPYINTWTLPYGKLHIDDMSVVDAAQREAHEKLAIDVPGMRHVGDCYIRVMGDTEILSSTLAHIVRFETDDVQATELLQWMKPLKLNTLALAPAVEQIVTRAFFGDRFFFEEFIVDSIV
jgi:ADP-ribose pyrophosphatase YjhB (NUDIX family)